MTTDNPSASPTTPSPTVSKRASALLSRIFPSRGQPKSPVEAPSPSGALTVSHHAESKNTVPQAPLQGRLVRVLVMGAGSRGHAYAKAINAHNKLSPASVEDYIPGVVTAVAEPDAYKRNEFGRRFVWSGREEAAEGESFSGWKEWIEWEKNRRERVRLAQEEEREASDIDKNGGVDAVFVCVLDDMHVEVIEGIKALGGVHIMCEKPLATSLEGCVRVWKAAQQEQARGESAKVFGICHVLRYSPHNTILRELVRDKEVVGDVISVEHTEPVGWWHFSHSYVRGNWRKESKTAPSLLTKSCHDIDWLLWMLCSPTDATSKQLPHHPAYLSSTGSLKHFRKSRKPAAAGNASNCLSCPIEKDCIFSAKKIYIEDRLMQGDIGWPVKIVNPEIEECYSTSGLKAAVPMLTKNLEENYTVETPVGEVEARPWFGRCVWESDNDVCDDQYVTITWDDDPTSGTETGSDPLKGRIAKTATFHMVAFTVAQCERRGRIYGTKGEIEYDSTNIWVNDFATKKTEHILPKQTGGGHGGGDSGLARQFMLSVDAVINRGEDAEEAQKKYLGCTLEEVIRSHAMVFAAEEARLERRVVDWVNWWQEKVEGQLDRSK